MQPTRLFKFQGSERPFSWADIVIILGIAVLIYAGVQLALAAPEVIERPTLSLEPARLPLYAAFSVGRMAAAYALSILFTLVYGYVAAYNHKAERVLMPLLDVLQSVPILSFLPVVVLSLTAILPEGIAIELGSIVLIFTSQVWNMTFAWYQSLITIPKELREASDIYQFNGWMRLKTLELPFAALSLIWNSMMSWAGGWFFLMAAEIFTVGSRDFRLPGLGGYLKEAAGQGEWRAIAWGLGTLILVIVLLDQLIWRPLLAWSDRFKVGMAENDHPPTSWFYDLISRSRVLESLVRALWNPVTGAMSRLMLRLFPPSGPAQDTNGRTSWLMWAAGGLVAIGLAYGALRAGHMLVGLPLTAWGQIGLGVGATLLRVMAALVLALAWTIPLGVAIGLNPRLAAIAQPIVQIAASVPATALFPVFLLLVLSLPGGLNLAAVALMLMGTQWYLLFNVIAGASAIPQDLKYTTRLLGLRGWKHWRTLILPALFPAIVTGGITASGGAWNASIVAEYVEFGGQTLLTTGIGSLIAQATANGNYPLLLASTLTMVLVVVAINRIFWRRLYQLAEDRFRME
ncbi:MAG: ABC transporter permease subunit [Anaerolineae bacterium]|nr:ABC transporter permease subunit [Anaerolineae bacterium]